MTTPANNEQRLFESLEGLGAEDLVVHDNGDVDFFIGPFPGFASIKKGGVRIRGSIFLDRTDDSQEADRWLARQPQPDSGVLERVEVTKGDPSALRILFERTLAHNALEPDPLVEDVLDYGQAWHQRTVVGEPITGERFEVPGDPRDLAPANGWLLMGSEAAFPSDTELRDAAQRGRVGIHDYLWTTAKQTEPGDLALIYFTSPRKSVHFVMRAASRAFFDRTIGVAADGKVADEQWWAYFTAPIEVEPIPLDTLRAHAGGPLPLRGRSGHYLRPQTVEELGVKPKHPEDQAALDRLLVTPVGRADLPDPQALKMDEWPHLASGAMIREAYVSQYIVEPLLRHCLADTHLTWRAEHPVGKKWADYVVLDGESPRCVIEVKLALRESSDGKWAHSNDFIQMRGYADALDCPGILVDATRILLVARNGDEPDRIIERRRATPEDLNAIRRHLT